MISASSRPGVERDLRTDYPPSHPVEWHARERASDGRNAGAWVRWTNPPLVAQFWQDARREASRRLGLAPELLEVERVK